MKFVGSKIARVSIVVGMLVGCGDAEFSELSEESDSIEVQSAALSATYTKCADEWSTCQFTGTRVVRYGADGKFVLKTLTNGTACRNDAFGGDPAVGVTKSCALESETAVTPPVTPPASTAKTYTPCAKEWDTCSFTGTKVVRYGNAGKYLFKTFTNGTACRNDAFGGDPLVGAAKACDIESETPSTPTQPTPPPVTEPTPPTATGRDKFGVQMIYPTKSGGREWQLPANAEASSTEWNVETNPVSRVADGVFHTSGNNGETRLTVSSPSGQAWWRNVEMTGYFRYTGAMDSNDQERHWEFSARSEKHTSSNVVGNKINLGVGAPAGTSTWPGYPYGSSSVNGHCLGTSYHGNVYVAGHVLFEKEVSHSGGYAGQRGRTNGALGDPLNRWFGFKYVVRNADSDRRVHMELWLDTNASGNWKLISQYDDVAGAWAAGNTSLDGCTAAPFNYKPDQLMTWAGPWLTFRSDSIGMDFKSLSAREIAPL